MAAQDDLNTPVIAVVGLLSAILLVVIIVLLMVIYYHVETREEYDKNFSRAPAELGNLVAKQQATLASFRWVDRQKQIVAVPIDRAMGLVVAEDAPGGGPSPSEAPPSGAKEDPDAP